VRLGKFYFAMLNLKGYIAISMSSLPCFLILTDK